tara:strand:- start:205 stop:345 length:141 start_codon:yes stop_codon:yes gene_type:complete
MNIGDKLNYFGKDVEVVDFNKTHVLIIFKSGIKICTNKFSFKKQKI